MVNDDDLDESRTPHDLSSRLEELLRSQGSALHIGSEGISLHTLLGGAAAHRLEELASTFRPLFKPVASLAAAVQRERPDIERELLELRALADPHHGTARHEIGGFADYPTYAFFQKIAAGLYQDFAKSYRGLFEVVELYDRVIKPMSKEDFRSSTQVQRVSEAMERIARATVDQIPRIHEFSKTVTAAYRRVQEFHRSLRHKYEGTAPEPELPDDMPEMFKKMLRKELQREQRSVLNPDRELLEDNCVLTEAMMDIAAQLPKYVESVVPAEDGGVPKVLRKIDTWEVEDFATAFAALAHPRYVQYLARPNEFTTVVTDAIRSFYAHYSRFEPLVREVIKAMTDTEHIRIQIVGDGFEDPIANPDAMLRRMRRLNFLAIRPKREEITPRSKLETDYGTARRELYTYLSGQLTHIATQRGIPRQDKIAQTAARTAIDLKECMDEILKTEGERKLQRDIEAENEFYVGTTGDIGSFGSERRPAPRIRMDEVVGSSFDAAKAHIEEVVDIAAYPQLLRASAPRGTIKSNLLLIGPYGCGKTELARAVCGDRRVIGLYVSVADALTAYMHESVKNVKRIWEEAGKLRRESRDTKPVALILDEFDGWFVEGKGMYSAGDHQQMERTLQEVMDGVVNYEGVFVVALTNHPSVIPDAILRRFKYVDVVGKLTADEGAQLMERFLTKLPVDAEISAPDYRRWAEQLQDATGDVYGKIADEIHFKLMRTYLREHSEHARVLESELAKIEKEREIGTVDYTSIRNQIGTHCAIHRADVDTAIATMLLQPAIQKQIDAAREVYREADKIMQGMMKVNPRSSGMGFTAGESSKLWTPGHGR